MPDLGVPELIIIAVVVLVLFGSKKLPDAARALGRSLRIFKAETKGLRDDDSEGVTPVSDAPRHVRVDAPPAALEAPARAAQPAAAPEVVVERRHSEPPSPTVTTAAPNPTGPSTATPNPAVSPAVQPVAPSNGTVRSNAAPPSPAEPAAVDAESAQPTAAPHRSTTERW